jgi:hypothetical protein
MPVTKATCTYLSRVPSKGASPSKSPFAVPT